MDENLNATEVLMNKNELFSYFRLKGKTLSVMGGLIKLTPENIELLGGKVDSLIEKWKLQVSEEGRGIYNRPIFLGLQTSYLS